MTGSNPASTSKWTGERYEAHGEEEGSCRMKIRSSLRSHRWILNRRILPNVWQPGFGTAVGVPLRERYSIGED